MAMNEVESTFVGKVLTWGILGVGAIIVAVVKFLDMRNKAAKEEFLQAVEPELKTLRETVANQEKRITALENGQRESARFIREIYGIGIETNNPKLKELALKAEDALHK